jgi:hypothetical protein
MLDKLRQWLVYSGGNSSDDLDVCEFDCHKTECVQGDWETCERRLAAQRWQHPEEDTTTR